jgi:hypothetical protein
MVNNISLIKPNLIISENVAIVGSSKNLLGTTYGEEINQYDDVIRFNRAPTKGYEKYVGDKTTIRITNVHVFKGSPPDKKRFKIENQPPDFIKKQENCKIICIQPHCTIKEAKKYINPTSTPYFMHPSLLSTISHKFNLDKLPTAGFAMVYILIKSGITPTLYGFGVNENKNPSHYWEDLSVRSKHHRLDRERKVLLKWIEKEKIILKK